MLFPVATDAPHLAGSGLMLVRTLWTDASYIYDPKHWRVIGRSPHHGHTPSAPHRVLMGADGEIEVQAVSDDAVGLATMMHNHFAHMRRREPNPALCRFLLIL